MVEASFSSYCGVDVLQELFANSSDLAFGRVNRSASGFVLKVVFMVLECYKSLSFGHTFCPVGNVLSLRRIPSWGQGNDPEKMMILLTCSVNLRALKIPDHCSPCKSLRFLLYHLLKRLLNILPSEFVLLMFEV